jgi:hypothetical protein
MGKFQAVAKDHWDSTLFPSVIAYIYESSDATDRGLRDIVVDITKTHLEKLMQKKEFEKVLEENGDFGKDILKLLAKRPFAGPGEIVSSTYKCPNPSCQRKIALWIEPGRGTSNWGCCACGHQYSEGTWMKCKITED